MRDLKIGIIIFLGVLAMVYTLELGVERQEKIECVKWQNQAKEIRMGWYATDWQKTQCAKYGISLQQ